MGDSASIENREWDKRVSGGRGSGFAMSNNFAGPYSSSGGKTSTNVESSKRTFGVDSVLKADGKNRMEKKGRNHERKARKRAR